jgi:hypothetical protein
MRMQNDEFVVERAEAAVCRPVRHVIWHPLITIVIAWFSSFQYKKKITCGGWYGFSSPLYHVTGFSPNLS